MKKLFPIHLFKLLYITVQITRYFMAMCKLSLVTFYYTNNSKINDLANCNLTSLRINSSSLAASIFPNVPPASL